MAKPAAAASAPRPRLRLSWRVFREFVRRTYAVLVILLTAWLSYLALRYLVVTLMFPSAAPPQITGIPIRMDEEVLRTRRSAWLGLEALENPRTPLAHYHRLDSWIQPDRFNDCTQSGCHASLPHHARREVRAFLNMHSTALHCGVCHIDSREQPLPAVWYDVESGEERSAPAVLEAFGRLTAVSDESLTNPAAQEDVWRLLRAAAAAADHAQDLELLAEQIAAVRHTSPEYRPLLAAAREMLPRYFRGEYGVKLALRDRATGAPLRGTPGVERAVDAYLREADQADADRRAELVAAVHPRRRPEALHCMDCHRMRGGLLDFAALGYPPARIEMLARPAVFRMIERIGAGEPFYLPQFVAPTTSPGERPGTAPARP